MKNKTGHVSFQPLFQSHQAPIGPSIAVITLRYQTLLCNNTRGPKWCIYLSIWLLVGSCRPPATQHTIDLWLCTSMVSRTALFVAFTEAPNPPLAVTWSKIRKVPILSAPCLNAASPQSTLTLQGRDRWTRLRNELHAEEDHRACLPSRKWWWWWWWYS